MPLSAIYSKTITIPATAIDENGHVNNVIYVQWMQDIGRKCRGRHTFPVSFGRVAEKIFFSVSLRLRGKTRKVS
jgi:acyl-CoA thioesterase FadM